MRLMRWIFAVALLAAGASQARAEEAWRVGGGVEAYSAPVLPGVVLGGALEASRVIAGPWSVGARVSGGSVTEANEYWKLQQTHLTALVGGSHAHAIGAGSLVAGLEFGSIVIREDATRHQFERLTQAGIDDRERISWSAGPVARLRLGASVSFSAGWAFAVELGEQLALLRVSGAWSLRDGLYSSAGVTHAF